jgi:hypothetical protein
MIITVAIRNVYGNELIYPVCDKAKAFADIAGTKTLQRWVLDHIKSLGYKIEVEQKCL